MPTEIRYLVGTVWKRRGRPDIATGSGAPLRGSLAVGSANYAIPGSGVLYVNPATGNDTTGTGAIGAPYATVNKARTVVSAGGTVICRAGIYHESFTTTAGNNAFTVQAYPSEAVWFDGSVIVTTWTSSGGVWVHTGVPTQFSRLNSGNGSLPASYNNGDVNAAKADQVFIDGVPLLQIADSTTPAAGQFSVNYGANTITIGSSPVGHEVRVSDLRFLCVAASVVSWRGVGVRYYAPDNTSAVAGAFYYGGSSGGSSFENVVVKYSAMAAMNLNKHDITVTNCTITNNTHTGIGGTTCDGMAITQCLFTNNNTGLFKAAPTTGAIKITQCIGLTIDNNLVQENNGANGIWVDVTVVQCAITNNNVTGNHRVGIQMEESDGGFLSGTQYRNVIAGNIVSGGTFGITLLAAGHCDIFNNLVYGQSTEYLLIQQDRVFNVTNLYLTQTECPWDIAFCVVANNIFGPGTPVARTRIFDSFNNRSATSLSEEFRNNQFKDLSSSLVQWGTASKTYTSYSSLATFETAEPTQAAGNVQSAGTMSDALSLALPANVAAALSVATGTHKIGPYITA